MPKLSSNKRNDVNKGNDFAGRTLEILLQYFIQFREADFVPRSKENYEYHCSLLDGPLSESDSVTYGINYNSPLNKLTGFHVANGQLPQDVMHLLLEGVIPYEIRLLLSDFITVKKYFTLEYLNDRIMSFTYSPDEAKDKPPPIKSSDLTNGRKISMAGMSDKCVIRV